VVRLAVRVVRPVVLQALEVRAVLLVALGVRPVLEVLVVLLRAQVLQALVALEERAVLRVVLAARLVVLARVVANQARAAGIHPLPAQQAVKVNRLARMAILLRLPHATMDSQ